MTDLATWLLEQITEDERVTREEMARRARWQAEQEAAAARGSVNTVMYLPFDDPGAPGDPARVLVECDAKRQMFDEIFGFEAKVDGEWGCCHSPEQIRAGTCKNAQVDEIEGLRILALPYAQRPGYQQEWMPDA